MTWEIREGDVLARLREMPDESAHCVVTSPPYWGLRDYGTAGQLGLEATPDEYLARMVEVFREVKRVLRSDGTAWINMGDSYGRDPGKGGSGTPTDKNGRGEGYPSHRFKERLVGGSAPRMRTPEAGEARSADAEAVPLFHVLKPKDLIGMPWRLAFALQADGWYLRSDIIWCLSASTRVYARTRKGEQPMTIHDLVRLDPATVQLWNGERWTQVLGWNRSQSETLRLTLRSGERIIASPEHRWPLADETLRATRDLRLGDVLATTRLPEPDRPNDAGIPADLAWFAGLYLAEGSHSDDAIQIAGNVREVERHERTIAIAERYGGSAVIHAGNGDGVSVVVHGAILEGALRHFVAGRTALDKHLHPRAWRSSNATLRAFMEGYLTGDAHEDGDRWRLGFGNNPHLADTFRTLAARLGASLTLSATTVTMGRTRRFDAYRGEWRWTPAVHHNAKHRSEIVAIEPRAASEVWDIGVADEPHLYALASGVLTHNSKPNPMPESVTDRPTKSHEYVFLMTKAARYYYDADAIREAPAEYDRKGGTASWTANSGHTNGVGSSTFHQMNPAGRNARSVWSIATQAYPEAHFATFPEELPRRCILAGTSERGVCGDCGAPWTRIVERGYERGAAATAPGTNRQNYGGKGLMQMGGGSARQAWLNAHPPITTGWEAPSCAHNAEVVPATVLDPFAGSGTTVMVAARHGRNGIGIELNPEYAAMARRRIVADVGLVAEAAVTQDEPAQIRMSL